MRVTRLLSAVRESLEALGLPGESQAAPRLVVGLSGGADSVALLDALTLLGPSRGYEVVAAHLDHGLRPDSDQDARHCRDLCARLGVRLRTGRADVRGRALRDKAGIEDAGRRERYAFLANVMRDEGAQAIAVAHTRDDQAETLLLRLLRGAGSHGLSGMRPRSGEIVRPLLEVSREEVIEHNRARGLLWRDDPSNSDPVHLRNRVRHELLPYLEARFNPAIRQTLARSARLLAEEADLMGGLGDDLLDEARVTDAPERGDSSVVLRYAALREAPRAVARAAVRGAAAEAGLPGLQAVHVERILGLAHSEAPSGRRVVLPGGAVAEFSFHELRIGPAIPSARPFWAPLPVPGAVDLPGGGRIEAQADGGPVADRGDAAVVPVPEAPLAVRTRLPGDRISTRGRTVSLKRFLMNRHVPAPLRGDLPLVASGREVVWVPGQPVHPLAEPRPDRGFVRLQRLAAEPDSSPPVGVRRFSGGQVPGSGAGDAGGSGAAPPRSKRLR